MNDPVGALEGIRIIDFSHVFQGPVGTQILADYGADVIKIERPGAGDWSRQWGPYVEGVSLPYACLNRNKRSVTLNAKNPAGKHLLLELIESADVLVHNFRPGTMDKLGLGWEPMHALNPRLIYAQSSGWGDKGPYVDRRRPGHDMLARAASGLFDAQRADGLPLPGGISADYPAGMLLMQGILIALLARERTGEGQIVSTDLFSVSMHTHAWGSGNVLNKHRDQVGGGLAGTEEAIQKSWHTKDGYLEISPVFAADPLRDISTALGLGDMAQDPLFRTDADRVENAVALNAILQEKLMEKTAKEWEAELEPKGVLCTVINTFEEALEDPQIEANDMIVELEHPKAGTLRLLGTPIRLSGTPPSIRIPPADLGEHNDEVVSELGYSSEEIARFHEQGVFG